MREGSEDRFLHSEIFEDEVLATSGKACPYKNLFYSMYPTLNIVVDSWMRASFTKDMKSINMVFHITFLLVHYHLLFECARLLQIKSLKVKLKLLSYQPQLSMQDTLNAIDFYMVIEDVLQIVKQMQIITFYWFYSAKSEREQAKGYHGPEKRNLASLFSRPFLYLTLQTEWLVYQCYRSGF